MLKKSISLLLVLLLSLSILGGCEEEELIVNTPMVNDDVYENSDKDNNIDTNEHKILRIFSMSDIETLDPTKAAYSESFNVIGNTMEGLFILVGGDRLQHGVCESYSVSKDGKTYRFYLRKDSFWSNGEPVTAHDFVYSWRRLAQISKDSTYGFNIMKMASIKNIKDFIEGKKGVQELGISAEDDYTLVLELDEKVPYLPSLLAYPSFYPINQKFAEGKVFGNTIETTLFNGPYVLDRWQKGFEYVLKKNENYWNKDNINIDVITVRIVNDYKTALEMYENGEIDLIGLSSEHIHKYSNNKNLNQRLDSAVFYLTLNQENEILKNVNARKAIALGFDKTYIINEILKNNSITADYLVPNNFSVGPDGKYFRDSTETYNNYNKEEAAKYWNKAKEKLGIENATLTILTYDSETSRKINDYLKQQLESNLEGLTINVAIQKFGGEISFNETPKHDIKFSGWRPDYLDPMTFLDLWTTDSPNNEIKYSSKEYDSIIEKCKTGNLATDLNNRWTELQKAERILLEDDVVIVPLYQRGENALIRSYVKNLRYNSIGPDYYFGFMDIVR